MHQKQRAQAFNQHETEQGRAVTDSRAAKSKHSGATNAATGAKIVGLVLVELPKTREMDEELVDDTTACARPVRSTSRVQGIRAIHSQEPHQFLYCSPCY